MCEVGDRFVEIALHHMIVRPVAVALWIVRLQANDFIGVGESFIDLP